MKSRAALIFFIAAIACTLIFGFLILRENASDSNSAVTQAGSCQPQSYHFNKDLKLSWSDHKYFVSFDDQTQKIQLNTWSYSNEKFNFDKVSEAPLICVTPGYHCLPAGSEFKVTHFKPPYGLISIEAKKGSRLLPFSWDSKQDFRLGTPMMLCGKNVTEIEKGQFFWIKDQLFFYDYKRNMIGNYSMGGLTGTSPNSALVDARKVMSITTEGFLQISSCESIAATETLEPYHIQVENTHLLIFKSNARGVFYNYNEDFAPLFKTTASVSFAAVDDDHKMIYFSDSKNLYSLSEVKLEDTLVDATNNNLLSYNVYVDINTPVVYSSTYKKMLSFNSKKFLGSDEIKILDLARESHRTMTNTFNITRKPIDFFKMGQLSAEISYYFMQRKNSPAEFTAVTCK